METNNNLGELLPINESNGNQAVNARDLHKFLEISKDFTSWMKAQIERCDLTENVDYEALTQKVENSNGIGYSRKTEYALSLNAAKEISMMSQTEKGKQARRYFIACEEKLKEVAVKGYIPPQQPVQPQPLNPLTLTDMTSWVKDLKDILRLNDASTLEMLQDVSNQYGGILPVPKYTKSEGEAKPASTLFEKRGYGKKSRTLTSKLNEVLSSYGILTKIPREKSDGSTEYFWSITDEGSPYGENDIPRGFKKKTQPLWYVDKFDEMLSLVNFNPEDYIKR